MVSVAGVVYLDLAVQVDSVAGVVYPDSVAGQV